MHETQSEIQKAGPKRPSVKPVAQKPIAEHHGAEVEGNAKQVKNVCRWKVIEIRPMPKVNSKYTVHGSGKPGVTQNRQQQHAVHRQYTSSSLQQSSTIQDSLKHHCITNRVISYRLTSILNLISKTWANLCDTKFLSALYAATSSNRVLS